MHKIIFILLATLAICANAESPSSERVEQTQLKSTDLGNFRFVLHNLENHPYSYDTNKAEVLVTKPDGQLIQRIPVEISFSNPSFDFIDLNDDGYTDLLINTSDIPNGSIPLPEAFLYIPKLHKFVKSNTLSGLGEISKSKNHGCVLVTYERNIEGATVDEWCFNLSVGRWKMTKSDRFKVGK